MASRVENDEFPWSQTQIHGAVIAAINDHGEITKKNAWSLTKRIRNQLYGATAPTQAVARLEAAKKRELELAAEVSRQEEVIASQNIIIQAAEEDRERLVEQNRELNELRYKYENNTDPDEDEDDGE